MRCDRFAIARRGCAVAATLTARRYTTTGSYPPHASSFSPSQNSEHAQGWELRKGHHLQSSVGQHSSYKTACGRMFNPQDYHEVLQACCDQKWLIAVQREVMKDEEYYQYLRQNGGAGREVDRLTQNANHDDEFMLKLKSELQKNVKVSLTLCAIQDAYQRIRRKRDEYETQTVADGGADPYAAMRAKQSDSFGSSLPQF